MQQVAAAAAAKLETDAEDTMHSMAHVDQS